MRRRGQYFYPITPNNIHKTQSTHSSQQIKFQQRQTQFRKPFKILVQPAAALLYFYLSKNVAIECNSVWNIETSVGDAGIPHGSYVRRACARPPGGWVSATLPLSTTFPKPTRKYYEYVHVCLATFHA